MVIIELINSILSIIIPIEREVRKIELCEWLEQKGFTDNNGYFTICNENEEEIGDSIEEWAKENCEQYSIDYDHVFDSSGLDIYCYAVGYVKYGKVHSVLISCYLY